MGKPSSVNNDALFEDNLGSKRKLESKRSSSRSRKKKKTETGRWTEEEHRLFLEAFDLYGDCSLRWKMIAEHMNTRTDTQVRTHAQKYFQKLESAKRNGRPTGMGVGMKFRQDISDRESKSPELSRGKKEMKSRETNQKRAAVTPKKRKKKKSALFNRKMLLPANEWMHGGSLQTRAYLSSVARISPQPQTKGTADELSQIIPQHRLFSPLKTYERRGSGAVGGTVEQNGIAIQGLHGGNTRLGNTDGILEDIALLLQRKEAQHVYKRLSGAINREAEKRGVFSKWRDAEFVEIVDEFSDEFADNRIKVVVCKRKAGAETLRWLEFIDTDIANDYSPQYDISTPSGTVIKTIYYTIEFPDGVYVERIKRWGRLKRLRGACPPEVAEVVQKHGLGEEYDKLVEACSDSCFGKIDDGKYARLQQIVAAAQPPFEAHGVGLFLSRKDENVVHGEFGGYTEVFCWVELVDRSRQPSYCPPPTSSG